MGEPRKERVKSVKLTNTSKTKRKEREHIKIKTDHNTFNNHIYASQQVYEVATYEPN